jgi:hypothetical protein
MLFLVLGSDMQRDGFIPGTAMWPHDVSAQQPRKLPSIEFLDNSSARAPNRPAFLYNGFAEYRDEI